MFRLTASLLPVVVFLMLQTTFAQTTREHAIKQTINQLFTAMKNADAPALQACFADSAVLQTIVNNEGKISVRNEQVSAFASAISKLQPGDADERITYDVIKADNELAIVWAPYTFYWKGAFSHCGTDAFQMVRINGEWKIVYLIDTRRKEACK